MKPIKILLIEDSEGDILLTIEALSDSKIVNEVNVLKDGKEAIEFFASNPPAEQLPDLILLDINLPMKSGHEVLAYIKNNVSYSHIAVIMLTTSSSEKDILRAYDSYVNCYITKPIDASDFMDGVLLYLDKKKYKKSVFLLHQAAEHFYNTVLLVFTGYKPKTHNLDKLRHYAKQLSQELFSIFPFPIDDSEEIHLFDLLKKGYVDARYKNDYDITGEELKKLIDRIYLMQTVVQNICMEHIDSLND